MLGEMANICILETIDLMKIKVALNLEAKSAPERINCLTDLLFDEDDFGHSCYMLLNLNTSNDKAEMEWWKNEMPITDDCSYWYHHNRVRALEYIQNHIPEGFSRVLVHVAY